MMEILKQTTTVVAQILFKTNTTFFCEVTLGYVSIKSWLGWSGDSEPGSPDEGQEQVEEDVEEEGEENTTEGNTDEPDQESGYYVFYIILIPRGNFIFYC